MRYESIRYAFSSTSSSNTSPPRAARTPTASPPTSSSTDRQPPVVTPTAAPPTSGCAAGATAPAPTRARTASSAGAAARRASRGRPRAGIGPCSVTTPSRAATAWCSAVTSLYPTSTVGSAPRSADQSTRSIIRCAPYPPRTQKIARTSGSAHAVREVLRPRLVVTGQVAVHGVRVAHVRHHAHPQPPRSQDGDARIEPLRRYGTRRRDEGDDIALAQSGRPHAGRQRSRAEPTSSAHRGPRRRRR